MNDIEREVSELIKTRYNNNEQILALDKFNDSVAFVMREVQPYVFHRYDPKTIVGYNGIGYCFYGYDPASPGWKAFGGSKFELVLDDGEIVKCDGSWWDGKTSKARELFPDVNCMFIYKEIKELQKCYVYQSCLTDANTYNKLRASYSGEVYTRNVLRNVCKEIGDVLGYE